MLCCMHMQGVQGQRKLEGGPQDLYTLPYMWFLSMKGNTWTIDSVQHVAGP